MSTPGPGGPQPPEQDPHQPGPWGQQPPAGQPQGGSSAWGGQPQPWGGPQPDGQANVTQPQQFGPGQFGPPQPGQPQFGQPQFGQPQFGQPQFGPPQGGAPQKPKLKWLPVVVGVVGLIVVLNLVRGLMGGDPEAGDCMQQTGVSDFDTVDCSSDEAEFRILGTDADMTGEEFDATDPNELCGDFAEATRVFWYRSDDDSGGTVYCAEEV